MLAYKFEKKKIRWAYVLLQLLVQDFFGRNQDLFAMTLQYSTVSQVTSTIKASNDYHSTTKQISIVISEYKNRNIIL